MGHAGTCGSKQIHYLGVAPNKIVHRKFEYWLYHSKLLCNAHIPFFRVLTHDLHLLEKLNCMNGTWPLAVLICIFSDYIDQKLLYHAKNKEFRYIKKSGDLQVSVVST